ncbi:DUF167 family protein [Aquicella siphonis]|uniref:DUF167 family protein n=1 Tax=Aquicella siphonis TaxID=254247 RepID=UPI0011DD9D83|nr:DUF167 family protein [Aquicella siphonis]
MAAEASPWHYWRGSSLFIHVFIQPRASRDQITGLMTCPGPAGTEENCLKVRITAPPLEGRANKYLIKFLARCFKVPVQQVIILQGEHGRKKWVRIDTPTDLSMLNESRFSE